MKPEDTEKLDKIFELDRKLNYGYGECMCSPNISGQWCGTIKYLFFWKTEIGEVEWSGLDDGIKKYEEL